MLGLKIVFFLFGSTLVSSHVLRWGKHESEKLANEMAEVTPFITHFLPPGSNFFYKPDFYISSPIAKIIEKDCKPIEMIQEFRPPMPTFVLTPPKEEFIEYSVPAVTEDCGPILEPKPLQMPTLIEPIVPQYKPIVVPEAPILPPFTMPETPSFEPALIPEAPKLPPFTMPELPEIVVEKIPEPVVPCAHELPEFKPVDILSAPDLPPLTMPDFDPTPKDPVIVPEAPILPPLSMPELPLIEALPEKPCDHELEIPVFPEAPSIPYFEPMSIEPVNIPEAPVLPPFTMPELPKPIMVEAISEKECDHLMELPVMPEAPILPPAPSIPEFEPMSIEPVNIPEAPVLPPFTMPELPTLIVETIPEKNCDPMPLPELPNIEVFKPISIPQAPVLPSFTMPELPTLQIAEFKPEIPQAPVLPPFIAEVMPEAPEVPHTPLLEGMASQFAMSFPNYCAQTIVLERVLPKMAIHETELKRPVFKYPSPIPYNPSIY